MAANLFIEMMVDEEAEAAAEAEANAALVARRPRDQRAGYGRAFSESWLLEAAALLCGILRGPKARRAFLERVR